MSKLVCTTKYWRIGHIALSYSVANSMCDAKKPDGCSDITADYINIGIDILYMPLVCIVHVFLNVLI